MRPVYEPVEELPEFAVVLERVAAGVLAREPHGTGRGFVTVRFLIEGMTRWYGARAAKVPLEVEVSAEGRVMLPRREEQAVDVSGYLRRVRAARFN